MQFYHSLRLYPKKEENCFDVRLELQFETRFIGELNLSGEGTFTCKRTEKKHLFRKLNSIGLNYHLITTDKVSFKWIVINYTEATGNPRKLVTSRNYFLEHSKQYQFVKQGYELQSFLELEHFGLEKARLFESHNYYQPSLFNEAENGRQEYSQSI